MYYSTTINTQILDLANDLHKGNLKDAYKKQITFFDGNGSLLRLSVPNGLNKGFTRAFNCFTYAVSGYNFETKKWDRCYYVNEHTPQSLSWELKEHFKLA